MPATLTMTKIGTLKSAVRATSACSAGATSIDILTFNHGLGKTPHEILIVLRCIRAVVSTGTPNLVVDSYNATAVVARLPVVDAGLTQADFDVVCTFAHTIVQ